MSVTAIMRVKDEADIIASTVTRTRAHVDHILVADNGSTDGTREILDGLDVEVIDDHEVAYYQSAAMTGLADLAAAAGAEWVIPMDADEIWLPRPGGRIRDVLGSLDDSVLVAEAPLLDHVATGQDPEIVDPVDRMRWRRSEAAPLRKVAVRYREGLTIHQGNHSASFDGVPHPPTVTNALEVRHFPYRSVAQFVSKVRNGAAAYAASDLPEDVGAHWRGYGRILDTLGEQGIADVFRRWFWRDYPDAPLVIGEEHQPPLVFDPVL